ncbi:uclacyanin 1-like [Cannabis sativa]|uniref:uclacyanin 1-like n=1 Tax=Cannabis sativa TaxID=3483 RepID=UPI0029CA63F9|nr:uclacyanin 1-like [Cannabis sativa]
MEGLRPQSTVKAAIVFILLGSILFRCVSAAATANHSIDWDLNSNLEAWTANTIFHVGDSLVFSYTPVHDVVEVKREDYDACVISHPIKTHNDGNTVVKLNQQGRRYFVCGRQGHCRMGLKLHVVVHPRGADPRSTPHPCAAPEAFFISVFWLVITTILIIFMLSLF